MAAILGYDSQGRKTYTFEYTGDEQIFQAPSGRVLLETWGAGSRHKNGNTIKGGYAKGVYEFDSAREIYIMVGGEGHRDRNSVSGFNGGGMFGGSALCDNTGGGGGTDVRLSREIESRIIVAGGAGGFNDSGTKTGGEGGGLIGGPGYYTINTGGRQELNPNGSTYSRGKLGLGGNGYPSNSKTSGGGGGYYGGHGTQDDSNYGGGGGSSYIALLQEGETTSGINEGNGKVVITFLNSAPNVTLNTPNNATLYENDTLLIDGTAKDTDNNDIVNVRYQINNGTTVAIKTEISDGVTPILFSRQLTFKGGKLYYNDVAVTGALTEGTAHTLKVWSEDDKGGKSTIAERTFYVIPNRAPSLTINPFESISDLINADKVTFTGSTSDPDGNEVVVSYKLNKGLATEVYRGKDGEWSFDLLLKDLKDGENTIVVETVDSYNFKTSLTRKINKQANLTPLAKSVQRYTIVPPAGSAQGVLMWIELDETQSITAEISMTNGTEQEQFKPMTLDSSGPANVGTMEDFFKFRANAPAEKIAIKLSWTGDKPIFKVSGALTL